MRLGDGLNLIVAVVLLNLGILLSKSYCKCLKYLNIWQGLYALKFCGKGWSFMNLYKWVKVCFLE